MAQLNFGGVTETVVIRDEFPLEKAREVLKDETIAVIGYGVQWPRGRRAVLLLFSWHHTSENIITYSF